MTMADLATWSQLLSSLAVLITLVYLAIEVKQNTEALHAQTRQSLLAGGQAELFKLVECPEMLANFTRLETLTTEAYAQLHSYLLVVMRAREFAWLQYQKGIIDEDQWQTELAVIYVNLTTKRTRSWWNKIGCHVFNPRFAEFVEDTLAGKVDSGMIKPGLNWGST
jgi:hypothetical protein